MQSDYDLHSISIHNSRRSLNLIRPTRQQFSHFTLPSLPPVCEGHFSHGMMQMPPTPLRSTFMTPPYSITRVHFVRRSRFFIAAHLATAKKHGPLQTCIGHANLNNIFIIKPLYQKLIHLSTRMPITNNFENAMASINYYH